MNKKLGEFVYALHAAMAPARDSVIAHAKAHGLDLTMSEMEERAATALIVLAKRELGLKVTELEESNTHPEHNP